eukprot:148461_1
MAAIPVPVHFDGHNINIITEDSPSTCKNRTKSMGGFSKKNNRRNNGKYGNNKRGSNNNKTQIVNKIAPPSASKENVDDNILGDSMSNESENCEATDDDNKAMKIKINGNGFGHISNKENIDQIKQNEGKIIMNGSINTNTPSSKIEDSQKNALKPINKTIPSSNIIINKQQNNDIKSP